MFYAFCLLEYGWSLVVTERNMQHLYKDTGGLHEDCQLQVQYWPADPSWPSDVSCLFIRHTDGPGKTAPPYSHM